MAPHAPACRCGLRRVAAPEHPPASPTLTSCTNATALAVQVLYEPQYYGQLLDSLVALCRMGGGRWADGEGSGEPGHGRSGDGGDGGGGGTGGGGGGSGVGTVVVVGGGGGGCAAGGTGSSCASETPAAADVATPAAPGRRALPLCFICYRRRRYKEDGFEALARARGFASICGVPAAQLHPDFREGYQLIELVHDGRLAAGGA